MSPRRRTALGVAAAAAVLALSALWLAGEDSARPGAISPRTPSRWAPGAWPAAGRGMLWLVAGACAVAFDLLVAREAARSERGRAFTTAFAAVTGAAFAGLAVASFLGRM